jgi:alanyl-tRNA synthetase
MNFEEQCYLRDPYLVDFSSRVREVEAAGEGRTAVYLDETYFYPDSGGQPDDRGTLGGKPVVQVSESEKGVRHLVEGTLEPGEAATGHIDWRRRFDHMQQHSGQHLLSRVFLKKLGARTVSFHLGEETCTIDLEGHAPSQQEIDSVEALANELVFKDIPITQRVVGAAEFQKMTDDRERGGTVVRSRLPEGVDRVRIVEIEGIDGSTCCGTHVRATGEIGLIKILSLEKVRGNARIEFICGGRAARDYGAKHRIVTAIGATFTTDWREAGSLVEKVVGENKELRKKQDELGRELARFRATELSTPTGSAGGFDIVKRLFEEGDAKALRETATKIRESGKKIVLFGLAGASPALILACSSEVPLNMGEIMKSAAAVMGARGGGGKDFAQGGGGDGALVGKALDEAEKKIKEILGEAH